MPRGLGEFEQLLLFAVLRLGKHAYGVRIRQEIASETGKDVAAGAVYTGLDRLQNRGFVSSFEAESAPSRGGRRRKYYVVEPEGAKALHATFSNVQAMAKGTLKQLGALASEAAGGGPK